MKNEPSIRKLPFSRRRRARAGAGLGLAALLLAAAAGCSRPAQPPAPPPIPVRAQVVAPTAPAGATRYSGTVAPATRVDVAFKVNGYIDSVAPSPRRAGLPLQEGDRVRKGQVLARVRSADYQERLMAARASEADANANLRLAQQELDRTTSLLEQGAVTTAELDSRKARYDSAAAQVAGARSRRNEATLSLGDTTLTSPMDGVVLLRRVEVGTLVGAGTVGFVIADTAEVKVEFGVPDALARELHAGAAVLISSEVLGSEEIRGLVSNVAPLADSSSRLFTVESAIANPTDRLKPGMVVTVRVPGAAASQGALAIPLGAVVRPPGGSRGFAAFVVQDEGPRQVARLRDIELGDLTGNEVSVRRGLHRGDRVVALGASLLRDGSAVSVLP
jgi:RND family efflux transporter MFP subunit